MMLKRSVLVLFSLLGIEGCNFHTGPISESLNPESMDLKLLVCKVRSSIFIDSNQDAKLSIGDRITYVFDVSKDGACEQPKSTFYGVEEIVMSHPLGDDHKQAFVTRFQGTFRLNEGNLQVRGLSDLHLSTDEWKGIEESGGVDLAIANIFPLRHKLSVVGQGGSYTGYIGTAAVGPGDPAVVDVSLFRQFKLDQA